jgi:3-oxoacyl-[acyl-carrier protein] reductase
LDGLDGLDGKIALVTGASKGIGAAIALRLAERGARVAVNYNTSEGLAEQVAASIRDAGSDALTVRADVSDLPQVTAMVERIADDWGAVDILVNNAGIIGDSLLVRMTDEAWGQVIATNLNGTFYCTRSVLRAMVRKRWGRIVSISSVVGIRGNAGQANYSASKAGVLGFTKSLAKEVATRNITVNAVTPGYIRTDTVEVLPQHLKDRIMTWIPQGHFGEVDDIAHLVAFIASEKAKYMTGQVISVDGGMAI